MAEHSEKLAIIVTAQDLASGKLGKVRAELAGMGTAGKISAVGLGIGIKAARGTEEALGHLRHRISELAGPIGIIGLSGAAIGLGGAFEQGIEKAQTMGLAVEKLTGLTGQSAEEMSGLVAVFEKFGLDATVTSQIVGFTEKTLGKLSQTAAGAGKNGAKLASAQEAVTKAHERLRVATMRLNELESKGKATGSQLAAARNRVADATRGLAKAEEALAGIHDGKTAVSTSKLVALQRKYHVALTDSKGQALSFGQILGNVSDFYNSNARAGDKAFLAATLFGRGYAQLIPILKLGKTGIAEAEQAAKDLGLTLTAQNAEDLKKYREAVREAGDAVSGFELQLGLMVVPDLTEGLKSASSWAESHQSDIKRFFREGLNAAEALAGFITGTVVPTISTIGHVAGTAWSMVPAPLQDLLVKGFVADRTLHFLFGVSPGHLVVELAKGGLEKAVGGLLGGIFQRGGSPASPMWVQSVGGPLGGAAGAAGAGVPMLGNNLASTIVKAVAGGLVAIGGSALLSKGVEIGGPGGAAVGAAGGAGMIAGGALIAGPIGAIVGSIAAVVQTQQQESGQNSAIASDIHKTSAAFLAQKPDEGALRSSLAGIDQGISDLQSNPLLTVVQGDALDQLKGMKADTEAQLRGLGSMENNAGKMADDVIGAIVTTGTGIRVAVDAEHRDFISNLQALRKSRDPKVVRKAADSAAKHVDRGVGNAHSTRLLASLLKTQIAAANRAGNSQLAAALGRDLAKVERKIPGRIYADREIKKADQILKSHESASKKLTELRRVEADLKDRGLPHAASEIRQRIGTLQAGLSNKIGTAVAASASAIVGAISGIQLVQLQQDKREHAAGLLGFTTGPTDVGVAGEAGREAVAIVRRPRALSASLLSNTAARAAAMAVTLHATFQLAVTAKLSTGQASRALHTYEATLKGTGRSGALAGTG